MARIYVFPYHRLLGVDVPCDCDQDNPCVVCRGGLALCVVCGGAESSLTTDCPGERMREEVQETVSDGELDYDRREGWVQRQSGIASFARRDR